MAIKGNKYQSWVYLILQTTRFLISSQSIQNLEQALLELEKAAPSIRIVLESIPSLKKFIEAAKLFGAGVEILPGNNLSGENRTTKPAAQDISHSPAGEYKESFTDILMNTIRENGGKMTPIQVFSICRARGLVEDNREARLKVSSTMYYLAKKMKVLDGNGQTGYWIP